jgi:hypothetical protein
MPGYNDPIQPARSRRREGGHRPSEAVGCHLRLRRRVRGKLLREEYSTAFEHLERFGTIAVRDVDTHETRIARFPKRLQRNALTCRAQRE